MVQQFTCCLLQVRLAVQASDVADKLLLLLLRELLPMANVSQMVAAQAGLLLQPGEQLVSSWRSSARRRCSCWAARSLPAWCCRLCLCCWSQARCRQCWRSWRGCLGRGRALQRCWWPTRGLPCSARACGTRAVVTGIRSTWSGEGGEGGEGRGGVRGHRLRQHSVVVCVWEGGGAGQAR